MDKTIINQVTEQEDAIVIGKFDDVWARERWLGENLIKLSALLEWIKDHPEEIIQNVRVQKMTVNTKDAPGPWDSFFGIGATEAINLCISEIKGTANPQSQSRNDDSMGTRIGHSIDVTVKDCILSGYGQMGFFGACHRVKVIYNTISNIKAWNSIEFNGVWPLRADWKPEDGYTPGDFDSIHPGSLVKGNKIFNGGKCIHIYSSYGVTITENMVVGAGGNHGAISIAACGDKIEIFNNILGDSSCWGIQVYAFAGAHTKAKIFGNIIYNSRYYSTGSFAGHGIVIKSSKGGENTVTIYGNTIVGNDGDGIYNPEGWPVTVKNNIIVNNKGAGIRNGTNISYNDVWNNTGGNYINCSAGTGDISTDPLFADPENGDFHLKSQYGRWNGSAWVKDNVTSPCIDAGDPTDDYSNEPDYPNGRINLGAYGNTREASLGTPLATGTLKGKVTDKDTGLPIEG
ncbi:hypothetical protein DRJ16_07190, partial [Candidatus Woesearchaeota archaeon]